MENNKKKLVYISHPYGNNPDNAKDIEYIIEKLYQSDLLYDNYCFISPVHAFIFMYTTTEYTRGLSYCTDLLKHCDIMLLFGDYKSSRGCTEEKRICNEEKIPYIMFKGSECLNNITDVELHGMIQSHLK